MPTPTDSALAADVDADASDAARINQFTKRNQPQKVLQLYNGAGGAERQELLDLNRASPCKEQREQPGLQREMAAWTQWKRDREIRLS